MVTKSEELNHNF